MEGDRWNVGWCSVCDERARLLQDSTRPAPAMVGSADSAYWSGRGMGFRTRSFGAHSHLRHFVHVISLQSHPTSLSLTEPFVRCEQQCWFDEWKSEQETHLILCLAANRWPIINDVTPLSTLRLNRIVTFSHVQSAGLHPGVCSFDALIYVLPGIQRPPLYMRATRTELS